MWYVMDADPGARLIVGFNRTVEKEEYVKSLEDNTLLDLMNYEEVKEGDTFFINTGKIHAIGSGVMLAEIQQTSDITYRVFDFNRQDTDGNLRELHTEMALDAMDYERKDDFRVTYPNKNNAHNGMVDSPYFKTNYLNVDETMNVDLSERDSFTIYMCVGGEASITNSEGSTTLKRGETVLVPACSNSVIIETNMATLLEVSI